VTRRELIDAHLPEQAEAAAPAALGEARLRWKSRHCEERSDEAIQENQERLSIPGSLRRSPSERTGVFRRPMARDDGSNSAPARPLRLFARPEPIEALAEVPDGPPLRFRWRRVLHDVTAIEGPERIAAPWWRHAGAPTRDYFRAEDSEGRRFWLYREGLWGRETMRPKWFVHGLFG
jgi:protein ImuB